MQSEAPKSVGIMKFRFISALVGFFVGIICMWIWQNILPVGFHFKVFKSQPQTNNSIQLDDGEDLDVFRQFDDEDVLAQMQRMQKRMQRMIKPQLGFRSANLKIATREDEKYVYLELSIKGLDKSSLKIEVKDGVVNIQGQKKEKFDSGGETMENFQQSFSAPENVDQKNVDIEQKEDLVILKFPKKI